MILGWDFPGALASGFGSEAEPSAASLVAVASTTVVGPESVDFESSADFQVGSYDQRRVRASLNIPISETLAFRTAGIWEDRLGYLDNTFLDDEDRDPFDVDDFGFRQHLRWNLSDRIETLLTGDAFATSSGETHGQQPGEPSFRPTSLH